MSDTVVVTFGRMNPPTLGHMKLINAVRANARGADKIIFTSKKTGDSKNPLSIDEKLPLLKKAFELPVQAAGNLFDVFRALNGKYKKVVLVVGGDRVAEMEQVRKYNGKDYAFDDIKIVSAGARDPDADGDEGASATKLRALAKAGNAEAFAAGLPPQIRPSAAAIMRMIREHQEYEGLEELNEASMTLQQRLARRNQMRRIRARINVGRKRSLMKRADSAHLIKRARAAAKNIFRRKILGRMRKYSDLSITERAAVDARIKAKAPAIAKLANRLLPRIRKAEQSRALGSSWASGKKGAASPMTEAADPLIKGGIPRKDMPQFTARNGNNCPVKFAAERGIPIAHTEVDPSTLTVHQKTFDNKKVESIMAMMRANNEVASRPIVVSSDGVIVDGHHRLLAAIQLGKKLDAYVLGAPFQYFFGDNMLITYDEAVNMVDQIILESTR